VKSEKLLNPIVIGVFVLVFILGILGLYIYLPLLMNSSLSKDEAYIWSVLNQRLVDLECL